MPAVLVATLLTVLPLTPAAGASRVLALRPPAEVDPLQGAGEMERAFRDHLRIELWGRAALVDGDRPLQGATSDQRVWEAAEQLGDAVVAFWLERTAHRVHALYVVGRRRGRAVVEVFSLPAEAGSGEDGRVLAVKVSEALDALLFDPPAQEQAAWLGSPRPPPRTPAMVFELGTGLRNARRSPAQGTVAISVAQRRPLGGSGLLLELAAEAEVGSGRQVTTEAGTVDTGEGGAGLAVRALAQGSRWLAGGHATLGLTTIEAQGVSPSGQRGSARLWIPTAGVGGDLRWRLTPRLELRMVAAVGASLERTLLAINNEPVLDLGRYHVSGRLSLVFVSR